MRRLPVAPAATGFLVGCMLLALGAVAAGSAPAPREILHHADRARGNLAGIVWQIELRAVTRNGEQGMAFEVSSRAYDLLAESTAPPKDKGKRLLMVNGNMWFDRPGLSKPVPIAQRQRLLGQAAYGDIAATNYADDYDATLLPDEVVDGESCHVFDLTANSGKATYDRIRYWVSKSRRVGVKAHYFTASESSSSRRRWTTPTSCPRRMANHSRSSRASPSATSSRPRTSPR